MAFRRRTFRRRPKQQTQWTGNLADEFDDIAPNNISYMAIVSAGDLQDNVGVESGGTTLLRLRGTVTINTLAQGFAYGAVGIYKVQDVSAIAGFSIWDPDSFDGFINGNLLWHRSWMLAGNEVGDCGSKATWDVDVKAKRRLTNDNIVIVVHNVDASTPSIRWRPAVRALLTAI